MIVYTVIRHIEDRMIPLQSFATHEAAEKWAHLQMKFLDKHYFYSIAVWETSSVPIIPCKDKRLRLVK
jgi:hypothetical protein